MKIIKLIVVSTFLSINLSSISYAATSINFSDANKALSAYKQWMIGANSNGYVYPKSSGKGGSYNLKGSAIKKFFQYEKQGSGRGINLGWTNNASADTARKRAKWGFARQSNSNQPIKYGEPIAIAWDKTFIKYDHRSVGINLNWSKTPSYEWVILGGKPGQSVRKGKDWVTIYNLKYKQPMVFFDRAVGGDIGWADSKSWRKRAVSYLKKNVDIEDVVKVLRGKE